MSLSEIIKQRRATLRLTQLDLAEMSEISLATVKDIERGKGNPSLKTLEKVVEVLGMELTLCLRGTTTFIGKITESNEKS